MFCLKEKIWPGTLPLVRASRKHLPKSIIPRKLGRLYYADVCLELVVYIFTQEIRIFFSFRTSRQLELMI